MQPVNVGDEEPALRQVRRKKHFVASLSIGGVLLILTLNLIVLIVMVWQNYGEQIALPANFPWQTIVLASETPTPTMTVVPPTITPSLTPSPSASTGGGEMFALTPIDWQEGIVFLSIQDGLYSHLFAYQPESNQDELNLPLTRLTAGAWDDITPKVSPDGKSLMFSSNRDGFWDLYRLDLITGAVSRVTNTQTFDESPALSPDGKWVVFDSYVDDNLEIFIAGISEADKTVMRLTNNTIADYEPDWSPRGRQIAFTSTRNGKSEIWIADLDKPSENRFSLVSKPEDAMAHHPAWSPDGRFLAWAGVDLYGYHRIYVWDADKGEDDVVVVGSGDYPCWSPDGKTLMTVLETPQDYQITAYRVDHGGLVLLPPLQLLGRVYGITWGAVEFSPFKFSDKQLTPTPLWEPRLSSGQVLPGNRHQVVSLIDVEAPHPQLHDLVDESFVALRAQLVERTGWDLLSKLENAYIPLTVSLEPGMREDWLYTGRAFRFTPLPIHAGWMVVVREDFGADTYWRVYVRTRYQDGSQGKPLHEIPWNFDARYQVDPKAYEAGGDYYQFLPKGYWLDLTELARVYRWERLPALIRWRSSYSSTRFNEFVLRDGLDWEDAILEIYPPEVLLTPTQIPTPTITPTPRPQWYRSPTPTRTAPVVTESSTETTIHLTPTATASVTPLP